MEKKVSASVVNRLPRYYRYLTDLLAAGVERISSKELSEKMHVTASQIRQDLNCFGGFGQQGYGYNVKAFAERDCKDFRTGSRLYCGFGRCGEYGTHLCNQYKI